MWEFIENQAFLTVGLQLILFLIGFTIYSIKSKISRGLMMGHKAEITKGMIYDKEIDIRAEWTLLNQYQDEMEKMKKEIQKNQDEIELEKAKPKEERDHDKINELGEANRKLGCYGVNKVGKLQYTGKGDITKFENKVMYHKSNITEYVAAREYLKVKARAIKVLRKEKADKKYKKFEKEKLMKPVLREIKKDELKEDK